jgi:HTH-type transcriptional regulator/antitoxin HipB
MPLSLQVPIRLQVIAPSQHERADRTFGGIIANFDRSILKVPRQRTPARQGVLEAWPSVWLLISPTLLHTLITYTLYVVFISNNLYSEGMDTILLQNPSQLSLHLKSLRKSRKATQADMAKRLRITQERYSQIESNPELIATGRLLEILAILRVDVLLKLRSSESDRTLVRTATPKPTRRGEDW